MTQEEQTQVQAAKTPEEQKKEAEAAKADLDARIKGFNDELVVILGKYNLGLTGQPILTPDGRIVAKAVVVDDTREKKEKKETGLAAAEE